MNDKCSVPLQALPCYDIMCPQHDKLCEHSRVLQYADINNSISRVLCCARRVASSHLCGRSRAVC
eukprot:4420-Heterococcus_DN1.PRE.4